MKPLFHSPLMLALLLGVITFALFSPSIGYELAFLDDQDYITINPLFDAGFDSVDLSVVFTTFQQAMYAPLLWMSYMLDAQVWNAGPSAAWGFHLTNVILHALNAMLVFGLIWRMSRRPWLSFWLAALWAFHPLRVESVTWIAARKDVLSGLFALLSIGAYVRSLSPNSQPAAKSAPAAEWIRPRPLFFWLSAFFLGAGLLVKSSLVGLPFFFLLLDIWHFRRGGERATGWATLGIRLLSEKWAHLLLALFASIAASAAHHQRFALAAHPLSERILAVPVHYLFYLVKTILPFRLTPAYPNLPVSIGAVALCSLVLLGITLGIAWHLARHPNRWLGWLTFILLFLPAIGLVRFGIQSVADRFTYLPALGLSILLIPAQATEARRLSPRRIIQTLSLSIILLMLGIRTLQQQTIWHSTPALTSQILAVDPDNRTGLNTLAQHLLYEAGDFEQAGQLYDRIIVLGSITQAEINGKALCLLHQESPQAARRFLEKSPPTPNPYYLTERHEELARIHLILHQWDNAISHGHLALQSRPHDYHKSAEDIHLLLMTAAYQKGDMTLALAHARQFAPYAEKSHLTFQDLLPYYLLQWIEYYRADALEYFRQLIENQPRHLNNVVWGLATANWSPADPTDVLSWAERLNQEAGIPNPGVLDTVAAAQANAGEFAAAQQTLAEALLLLPGSTHPTEMELRRRLEGRQRLYQREQRYTEPAFGRLMAAAYGKGKHTVKPEFKP